MAFLASFFPFESWKETQKRLKKAYENLMLPRANHPSLPASFIQLKKKYITIQRDGPSEILKHYQDYQSFSSLKKLEHKAFDPPTMKPRMVVKGRTDLLAIGGTENVF